MDDSNNTPDVVDRNQLVGQIFIQPTRTGVHCVGLRSLTNRTTFRISLTYKTATYKKAPLRWGFSLY